jgi:hypothetical protein
MTVKRIGTPEQDEEHIFEPLIHTDTKKKAPQT